MSDEIDDEFDRLHARIAELEADLADSRARIAKLEAAAMKVISRAFHGSADTPLHLQDSIYELREFLNNSKAGS